jgi:AraC-like DNA-binding protein
MHAFFRGHAFSPHRHDTYAVGVTSVGVQAFAYRGQARRCLPGQVFVLHPDERHDGRAGDDRGFGYRIAYVDPALIREATGRRGLPVVPDPVSVDGRLRRPVVELVGLEAEPEDELAAMCKLVALADALVGASGEVPAAVQSVDTRGVARVRDLLLAKPEVKIAVGELEAASGLSRWQLARQFRAAFGVSPHRYQLLRRLDRARGLVVAGHGLAEAALASGFADQAHLTRAFRAAFGLSPGRWRALLGGPAA